MALIGAAGALAAFALFFGDGSTYPPLVWIGGLAVLAAAVGVALVLLGVLAFPRLDGFGVAFLALLGWFVLWNGLSIVWSLQPDRSWEYFNRGIVYFAFAAARRPCRGCFDAVRACGCAGAACACSGRCCSGRCWAR